MEATAVGHKVGGPGVTTVSRARHDGLHSTSSRIALPLLVPALVLLALTVTASAFAVDGVLDESFGGDGKVTTTFTGGGYANAVAIQSDGKIVAAGGTGTKFALARYDTDGALDTTFSNNGKVKTGFMGGGSANSVAIQSDGKIVAAGVVEGGSFGIARYNTDGALDPAFGTGGVVVTDVSSGWDEANGVAVQANGKIVLAGRATPGSPFRPWFALARYRSDGTLDESFGDGGIVLTKFGVSGIARAIVVQPNHRIVVAGTNGGGFALARYHSDGSLDTSFGKKGKVATLLPGDAPGTAYAVALQPDGRIVAAGAYDFYLFALARFKVHGGLDQTFGDDGFVITDVGQGAEQWVSGLMIQPNGRIVAAGSEGPHEFGEAPPRFVVARYRVNGVLDPTFGDGDGKVISSFPNGATAAGAVAQNDGRIVVVGNNGYGGFALARYV